MTFNWWLGKRCNLVATLPDLNLDLVIFTSMRQQFPDIVITIIIKTIHGDTEYLPYETVVCYKGV